MTSSRTSAPIPAMDGVRGLAALLVFLVHYIAIFAHTAKVGGIVFDFGPYLKSAATIGTDTFLVISGFIIYGSLLRKQVPYLPFIKRRIARIYPSFMVVFAIYVALSFVVPGRSKVPLHSASEALVFLVKSFFLLPGMFPGDPLFVVAWTLSYQFFFYFTIPLFVMCTRRTKLGRSSRILALLSICLLSFLVVPSYMLSHMRLLLFVAGVIFYEVYESQSLRRVLGSVGESTFLVALPVLVGFNSWTRIHTSSGQPNPTLHLIRLFVISVAICGFLLLAFLRDGRLKKLCLSEPLCQLGKISFSFYLIHGLMLHFVHALTGLIFGGLQSNAYFFALMPVSVLVAAVGAYALHITVEKPAGFPWLSERWDTLRLTVTTNPSHIRQ